MILKLASSLLGVASQVAGNFLFFVLLANAFGVERFGYFLYLYSIANLLTLLVDYGYPQRILREAGEHSEDRKPDCSSGLVLKIFILSTISIGVWLTSLIIQIEIFFMVLLAGFALGSFGDFFGSYIRAAGQHLKDSINLFSATAILILGVWSVAAELTEIQASIIFLLSKGVYLLLSFLRSCSARVLTGIFERRQILAIATELRRGAAYFLDVSLIRMHGVIDTILVRLLLGDLIVGLYQSGQRFLQGFFPMAQVLNNVFLPLLATKNHSNTYARNLKTFVFLNIGLAASCLLFFLLIAPHVLPLILGSDFAGIIPFLWMFGLYGGLRILSAGLAIYLTSIGGQVDRAKANAAALTVLIAFIFLLGILFDLSGIIMALSISNLVLLFMYSFSIVKVKKRYAVPK